MGQVTIYLEVEAKMRSAAKAMNTSLSQWVANIIKEKTTQVRPDSVNTGLAGGTSNPSSGQKCAQTPGGTGAHDLQPLILLRSPLDHAKIMSWKING